MFKRNHKFNDKNFFCKNQKFVNKENATIAFAKMKIK